VPALLLAAITMPAFALESLSENDMSGIAGQDGLSVTVNSPGMSASALRLDSDVGVAAQQGALVATPVSLMPTGGASGLNFTSVLDAGQIAGAPAISIQSHLDRARLDIGGLQVGTDTARSFGEWVLVSPLDFSLQNSNGIFSGSTNAKLYLALTGADLFYRQAWYYHANLAMHNLNFVWSLPAGTLKIDSAGMHVLGDVDFLVNFDWMYKFNPDQDMTTVTANDKPMLHLGWNGRLWGAEYRMGSGGVWTDASQTTRSEGINLGLHWNYKQDPATNAMAANDFSWQVGRASGNHAALTFGDWRNLESATGPVAGRYGFDFPDITIDAVPANIPGLNNLCWGGNLNNSSCTTIAGAQSLGFTVGQIGYDNADVNRSSASALLYTIRNGNLLAYSNQVTVSADALSSDTYHWGLIYTLANVNANIALYPGGSESDTGGGSRNFGIMGDVLFMTQSFGATGAQGFNWANGSNFMIADTLPGVNMGIGLMGSSYLLGADDLRLWVRNTWGGTAFPNNYDGGIDLMSPHARLELKGMFGGAKLPGGSSIVKVTQMDLNLEGLVDFRLSPPPDGSSFLAYSGALRLTSAMTDVAGSSTLASGNGSYFSLAEPGQPGVDFRFANMSGDIAFTEGSLDMQSKAETSDGKSHLALANKVLIGYTAASRINDAMTGLASPPSGNQVLYSDVKFGSNTLGKMVIPSATLTSSIILEPK
jgi:hypothetical protein